MVRTHITQTLIAGLIFAAILLLAGCAKKEEETKTTGQESVPTSSIQTGGIYRYPLMNNPSTLDPAQVRDQYGEAVVHQLFDGLVRFDPYLAVLPSLSETWKVEDDGTTYQFVLREDAQFHNGRPIHTDDVVFSISRLLRVDPPSAISPYLLKIDGAQAYRDHQVDRISGLERIDDRVVRIKLTEPHAPFITALGMVYAKIVPAKEIIQSGEAFWKNPVGSGPFRFVSWDKDRQIQLERFSGYYAGVSYLDGIHYVIYPGGDKSKVLADFREGRLDEMPVYGKIRHELSTVKGLNWFHRPSLSLLFYGIRENHPLLKHIDVRKVLSMAIDREKLVDDVYNGQFEPARTILPPGMPGYNRMKTTWDQDTNRAHELVKDAIEKKQGPLRPIEIVSAIKSSFAQAELKYIRESWARLGIPAEVKYITDWKAFENYLNSTSVQIYRYVWFPDMPDPESMLYPLFASDSPNNFMQFKNGQVDRMLQEARGIIDPEQRAKIYQEIEKIIIESAPLIPMFYLSVDRVYQPSVQGVQVSALGAHTMPLHRIWLKASEAQ